MEQIKQIQVRWREGFVCPVAPEAAYREFQAVERRLGRLEPEAVVERAADPQNPLHPAFEWDDRRAAHLYRVAQAKEMIRALEVEVVVREKAPAEPVRVRVYHSEGANSYANVWRVREDQQLRRKVLEDALRDLQAMYARVRALRAVLGPELDHLLASFESALQSLREKREEVYA